MQKEMTAGTEPSLACLVLSCLVLSGSLADVYIGYISRAVVSDEAFVVRIFSTTASFFHSLFLLWAATGPDDGGPPASSSRESESAEEWGPGGWERVNGHWVWSADLEPMHSALEIRVPLNAETQVVGPLLFAACRTGNFQTGHCAPSSSLADAMCSCVQDSALFSLKDRDGLPLPPVDVNSTEYGRRQSLGRAAMTSFRENWMFRRNGRFSLGVVARAEGKFLIWHHEVLPLRADVASGLVQVRVIPISAGVRAQIRSHRATAAEQRWGLLRP
jgi:hypothetical protein